jgi:hypothetical protein
MTNGTRRSEGSASCPGCSLPLGKTRYPSYRRLGGPQGRSGRVQKISPPPGFDPRTVQPIPSCYTIYYGSCMKLYWHWPTETYIRIVKVYNIFSTIIPIKTQGKWKYIALLFWKVLKLHFICTFGKSDMDEDDYEALVDCYWQGQTEVLREKHVPVPLCPLKVLHGLTWNWSCVSLLRSQRLAVLANAQLRTLLVSVAYLAEGKMLYNYGVTECSVPCRR